MLKSKFKCVATIFTVVVLCDTIFSLLKEKKKDMAFTKV